MGWQIVERKIGRAGSEKQRVGRQREWDRIYGTDAWVIGYVIDCDFVLQEEALTTVYYRYPNIRYRRSRSDLRNSPPHRWAEPR